MKNDENLMFQNTTDSDFFVIRKIKLINFIFWEILVFYLISLASFFAIFISTNNFSSEEKLAQAISLNVNYFNLNNLIYTSLGLFIVMGIICFINKLATNAELQIQGLLDRLIISVVDFYYLMFSTILGSFTAMLIYIHTANNLKITTETLQIAESGTLTLASLGALSAVALRYCIKQDEIKKGK